MTAIEFMQHLEEAYDKDLAPKVIRIYLDRLQKFNHDQLDTLADKVVETCKTFPKVAHIFEAAKDAGMFSTRIRDTQGQEWEPTSCPDCQGEGRLLVIMKRDEEGIQRPIFVGKYSGGGHLNVKPESGQYEWLFRCHCEAGDRRPKAIARWEPRSWQPTDSDYRPTQDVGSVKDFVEAVQPEDRWKL